MKIEHHLARCLVTTAASLGYTLEPGHDVAWLFTASRHPDLLAEAIDAGAAHAATRYAHGLLALTVELLRDEATTGGSDPQWAAEQVARLAVADQRSRWARQRHHPAARHHRHRHLAGDLRPRHPATGHRRRLRRRRAIRLKSAPANDLTSPLWRSSHGQTTPQPLRRTRKEHPVTTDNDPTRAAEDGGQDKVLAALAALGQATATEIADHAGLGYSTVTARLRKLAETGTVHKQPAGTGPTSWRPADPAPEPDNQPEPEDQPEPENQPAPVTPPEEGDPDQAEPTVNEVDEAEPDEAERDLTEPIEVEPGTDRDTASPAPPSAVDATGEDTDGGEAEEEPTTAPDPPDAEPVGGTPGTRRPPGKLREQVLGALQDHPDQSLTPHQISKLLGGASSGAIVLACRKLVGEGSARQVRERPATFQAK